MSGHKGEHRAANTKHDHDDITLQDLSLSPVQTRKKPTDFNKVGWWIIHYSYVRTTENVFYEQGEELCFTSSDFYF